MRNGFSVCDESFQCQCSSQEIAVRQPAASNGPTLLRLETLAEYSRTSPDRKVVRYLPGHCLFSLQPHYWCGRLALGALSGLFHWRRFSIAGRSADATSRRSCLSARMQPVNAVRAKTRAAMRRDPTIVCGSGFLCDAPWNQKFARPALPSYKNLLYAEIFRLSSPAPREL